MESAIQEKFFPDFLSSWIMAPRYCYCAKIFFLDNWHMSIMHGQSPAAAPYSQWKRHRLVWREFMA